VVGRQKHRSNPKRREVGEDAGKKTEEAPKLSLNIAKRYGSVVSGRLKQSGEGR